MWWWERCSRVWIRGPALEHRLPHFAGVPQSIGDIVRAEGSRRRTKDPLSQLHDVFLGALRGNAVLCRACEAAAPRRLWR